MARKAAKDKSYEYTKLCDLKKDGFKINVFGIVRDFCITDTRRAGVRSATIFITDDTIGASETIPFSINFDITNKNFRDIPLETNEIIRIHRASIQDNNKGGIEGCGYIDKCGCHFVLWSGVEGGFIRPKFSTSVNWTEDDSTKQHVIRLRAYAADKFMTHQDIGPSTCLPLNYFKQRGHYQHLLVQVIAVGESSCEYNPVIVRCWDGTKFAMQSLNLLQNFKTDVAKLISIDERLCSLVDDYAVDIFVYDEFRDEARRLKPWQFVKVGNVHASFKGNKPPSLILHGLGFNQNKYERGIWPLDYRSDPAKDLKKKLEQIIEKQTKVTDCDSDVICDVLLDVRQRSKRAVSISTAAVQTGL